MTWAKLDDGYSAHRKVRKLTDAEFRLDVSGICFSARHGYDGRIPPDELDQVADVKSAGKIVPGLVSKGRWHLPDHGCDSRYCYPISEGWLIHDFLAYNPTAVQAAKTKQARAESGQVGGRNSGKARSKLRAVGEANG